jgi:hypothetical protein
MGMTSTGLSKSEKLLVGEALRRGEQARDVMENALVDFGRWVLVNVFADDAAAALGERRDNRVWQDLMSRAGGPTLRVSERLMTVALVIAAHDKRIQDESWRLLEVGRKELLLPLGEESSLREGAQQVLTMKMSQRATREYVREALAAKGKQRQARLTMNRVRSHVQQFSKKVGTAAYERRMEKVLKETTPEERAALKAEVEAIGAWVKRVMGRLKG